MKLTTEQAITIAKALGALAKEGIAAESRAEPIEQLDRYGSFRNVGAKVVITFTLDPEGLNLESHN